VYNSNANTAWIPDCHHPKKGVDRRQPYVARLCLIVSLALEVIQKTQDRRGIQIECMERRWLFFCCLSQKLQQEPEGVPVAFHRTSTRPL
jgi:hypothetical protein